MESSPLTMKIEEVMSNLQVDRSTLDRWAKDPAHDFPKRFKLGRGVRYLRSEIMAWIAKQQRESA